LAVSANGIKAGMNEKTETMKPERPNLEAPNGQVLGKECWTELCRQASVEKDPRKLLQLVTEINRLLAERQAMLARGHKPNDGK
jgi:hypothetical protein